MGTESWLIERDALQAEVSRLESERNQFLRERDALEGMPIACALGGYVARIPWRKGGYPHGEYLDSGGYWFGSADLARKAVRFAAGLEEEAT